jgi:hypothetical protein
MKKIFFSILFILIIQSTYAQIDFIWSFNAVDVGRNVAILCKKDFNNHSILFGIKYHINSIVHDNVNNVFRRRFYATNFMEHFGLELGYQYNFTLKEPNLSPFIFYDLQVTHSPIRNNMFLPAIAYDKDNILYRKHLVFFGPYTALENNIGIGCISNITNKLFLYQKIGAGVSIFLGNDPKRLPRQYEWEFGYVISTGIGYRF